MCNALCYNENERVRIDRSKLFFLSLSLGRDELRSHGMAPLQSKSHSQIANCHFIDKSTSLEKDALTFCYKFKNSVVFL